MGFQAGIGRSELIMPADSSHLQFFQERVAHAQVLKSEKTFCGWGTGKGYGQDVLAPCMCGNSSRAATFKLRDMFDFVGLCAVSSIERFGCGASECNAAVADCDESGVPVLEARMWVVAMARNQLGSSHVNNLNVNSGLGYRLCDR